MGHLHQSSDHCLLFSIGKRKMLAFVVVRYHKEHNGFFPISEVPRFAPSGRKPAAILPGMRAALLNR